MKYETFRKSVGYSLLGAFIAGWACFGMEIYGAIKHRPTQKILRMEEVKKEIKEFNPCLEYLLDDSNIQNVKSKYYAPLISELEALSADPEVLQYKKSKAQNSKEIFKWGSAGIGFLVLSTFGAYVMASYNEKRRNNSKKSANHSASTE